MYAYDKYVPRQSLAFLEGEEGPLPASTGGTDQRPERADRPRANPKAKTKKTKSLAERVKAALRAGTDKISEAKGHLAWHACTRTSVHVYMYIYKCIVGHMRTIGRLPVGVYSRALIFLRSSQI